MNRRFRISLEISILLHLLLGIWFMPLIEVADDIPLFNQKRREDSQRIIEIEIAQQEERGQEQFKDDHDIQGPKKKSDRKASLCQSFYIGIGILTFYSVIEYEGVSLEVLHISEVYVGYPADRAGLRPGDYIWTDEPIKDGGPIGSPITLTVWRDGHASEMTLYRDKICTDIPKEVKD